MPDFEKFRLGAPVKTEIQYRGELKRVEVDGHFDVVVPCVSKADTALVATLKHDRKRLEYRLIEGRLFRPLLLADFQTIKLDRMAKSLTPIVNGERYRTTHYYRKTALLGSPWLDWEPRGEEVTDALRKRVQRAAPQSWEVVARKLQTAASRGIRFVDGLLFQETRTPGWGFAPMCEAIRPAMPDANDGLPSLLFDPRTTRSDLAEIARRLGTRVDADDLRVLEPSLIPNTIEVDAVAALALWANETVAGHPVGTFDMDRLTDTLTFVQAAERMAANELSPDACFNMIGKIAERRDDSTGIHHVDGQTTVNISRQAALLVELRQRLPAPTTPAPPEGDDAEDIAQAFRP